MITSAHIMSRQRGGGGRVQVHERRVDDATAVINADIEIAEEHSEEIRQTEAKQMEDRTRKNYRNQNRHIYTWWNENYPNYFEHGTRVLSEAERNDRVAFHHTNGRDLVYSGLNVNMVKAFLVSKKKKRTQSDGTVVLASVSDITKYDDAIKWASMRAGQPLPSNYYREMEVFVASYKKEHKSAKKDGRTDEQEADPITAALFMYICQWAIEEGNIFLWSFALSMWNLMARSISVDCLGFHHFKSGLSDSIKCRFDETKTDKTGEFVQEKNIYANPNKPEVCFFLALGCHLSLNAELLEKTEKFYINPGAKFGTASARFCTQLIQMISAHFQIA